MIHVTLKLLGPFRSCAAKSPDDGSQTVGLNNGSRLGELLRHAPLPAGVPRVVLLNGAQRNDDPQLEDGDVITVFPPIAGGGPEAACTH